MASTRDSRVRCIGKPTPVGETVRRDVDDPHHLRLVQPDRSLPQLERRSRARQMLPLSCDMIVDVGGESTRPGAKPVWEGDEIARIEPVIRQLASAGAAVSVDTRKADVMAAALAAGARMVNDVSALTYDLRSAEVVAAGGVPVVLMHHQGKPETMQHDPRYEDVVVEVYLWLEQCIAEAEQAGIARDRILVDVGFGFGKTLAHNLELMNNLALFHSLGCPLVLGASRKRTIGALANEAPVDQRLGGSIAFALKAVEQGVQVVRVHDVPETVQAFKVWRGLRDQALTPRI
jgi:dihydropteroate synthase